MKMTNRITSRILNKAVTMTGAAFLTLLTTAAVPAMAQSAAPATQPAAAVPANRLIADGIGADGKIKLTVNKTVVIATTKPFKQVSVGQPDVADVNMISPTSILVTAKRAGSTQLIVWDDQNKSQVADIVVNMDLEALQADLTASFPGSKITVSSLNGAIKLSGLVTDLKAAEQAAAIAAPYSNRVLNLLEVGGGQQVMLQVRFAEVSRKATNALGVNFSMSDGVFAAGSNIGALNPASFLNNSDGSLSNSAVSPAVTLFGRGQIGNTAFRMFVEALRQNNLLRILAEPNLMAISGQEASFLAGGEFPVPVPQSGSGGSTTITIDYKEFGVRLKFVPIVLGDGRIRMKMSPEVSDLDFSSPLNISGSNIPIVNKRTVTTTVELADGQTFALAGLLNSKINATRNVTPILGDLPVLGMLFRSTRYQREETEMVVLVTPHLVEPMNPSQVPALPGENWRNPTEAEIWLNADIGSEKKAAAPANAPANSAPAASTDSKYRGAYGFTPPPRATTQGTSE